MSDDEIQVGEEVRLKGGGAIMVVQRIFDHQGAPYAECVWHHEEKGNHIPRKENYAIAVLRKNELSL